MARKHIQRLPKLPNATERLEICLQHNKAWEQYARQLEAINNERVDIINAMQATINELEARLAVYDVSNGENVQ